MKNLWMLVALLSLAIGVKANHYGATVVIKSHGDVPILVKMDRHPVPQARTVHRFNGIRPGQHSVEIYRKARNDHYWGHQPPRLVYRGRVKAHQGYKTVYVLHRGVLRMASKKRLQHHGQACSIHGTQNCNCSSGGHSWNHGYGGSSGCGGYSGHGNGHGNGHQGCAGGCGGSCVQPHGNNWQPWNNWNGNYGYGQGQSWGYGQYGGHHPMSYSDFWSFRDRMRKSLTDAGKVKMADRELKDKWLTTEQVGILMDDLFFEKEKLELAQMLYHRTVDPERFGQLDSQFEFSTNKKQLSQYVERNTPK